MALKLYLGFTKSHIRKRLSLRTPHGGKLESPSLMKQQGLGWGGFLCKVFNSKKGEGKWICHLRLSPSGTLHTSEIVGGGGGGQYQNLGSSVNSGI